MFATYMLEMGVGGRGRGGRGKMGAEKRKGALLDSSRFGG